MNTLSNITAETPLTEIAERYCTWMREETRLTLKTRKSYGYLARAVAQRLTAIHGPDATARTVTGPALHAWAKDLEAKQARPRTVRAHLLGARAFCRWLVSTGMLAEDPSADVPFPKLDLVRRKVPTTEEVTALLDGCKHIQPARRAKMARAILHLLVFAGLRRTELLGLRPGDVDYPEMAVCVWAGKGGKGRRVYLPESALEAVGAWEAERGECRHNRLWDYDGHRYIADAGLRTLFAEMRYAAGLKDAAFITPHTLRHYYCSSLIRSGVDIEVVRAQMGHSELATTQMYIHADSEHLRVAVQRLDPEFTTREKRDPAIASIIRRAREEEAKPTRKPKSTATPFAWLE